MIPGAYPVGLFDRWRKDKDSEDSTDPLHDLTLSKLTVGYLVDFDLKTWEVKSYSTYDFDGDRAEEWELDCGDDQCFLERVEDDEVEWAITRKIALSDITEGVRKHIREHDDPPQELTLSGQRFSAEGGGAGYYYKDGKGSGDQMIYWDYVDSSGEQMLTIEQWGEDEFEASTGKYVQEYEFTNILPRLMN
ncbi:MAG TPA: DUF4178 domain-containing protein [Nitrospirales bacterium]|nr:DUF4178 domain-containing protein [Nitrospirales bacterium]